MTSVRAISLLIALFLVGALAGGFVGHNMGRRSVVAAAPEPLKVDRENFKPPGPGRFRPDMRQRLVEDLDLTDVQMKDIDPIIAETTQRLAAMAKESFAQTQLVLSNRDERIKAFLTPEQLTKLQERSSLRKMGPPRRDHERREQEPPGKH
jgi:hypothetical protein